MCGILGGLRRNAAPFDEVAVRTALKRLARRGPDAEGLYHEPGVFLGHRRLSIIDLDPRSNQPMRCGKQLISFNGEIYNYRELRRELQSRGHTFFTTSDTEVLLLAYQEYGIHCLDMLEGMFAFAIWDEEQRRLVLARDRFGEKPLFYYRDQDTFLFASEIPPLEMLIPSERLSESTEAMGLYFLYTYIPAPYAPYVGMSQMRPGEWLEFDADSWSCKSKLYYDIRDLGIQGDALEYRDAIRDLRDRLEESVRLRVSTADVPVATFLSGGIDSSAVTVLASFVTDGPLNAYSIAFPDDAQFDESEYARLVASRLPNIRHRIIPATESLLLEFTQDVLARLGEPFADASLIPTAYLCSRVEEKVILGGDGADELFAGYGVYPAVTLGATLPRWMKRLVGVVSHPKNPHAIRSSFFRHLALFAAHMNESALDAFLSWRRYASPRFLESLGLDTGLLRSIDAELQCIESGRLADIQAGDIWFNLPNDMLKKVDYASMLFSLEVRLPYLDRRLAETALRWPASYKMMWWRRKRILRDAFRDVLPTEVITRSKKGFLLPIRTWFKNGRLRDTLFDLVGSEMLFDRALIHTLLEEHRTERRDHSVFLWALFVYLNWRARKSRNHGVAMESARPSRVAQCLRRHG